MDKREKTQMRIVLSSLAVLALAACQPAETGAEGGASATETPAAGASAGLARTVEITLSPAAAARLAETNERITVSAFWYGQAAEGVEANEDGTIGLGDEQITLPGTGGSARLAAEGVPPADDRLAGPVHMNINVFSAREGNADNLLDCEFYDAPATDAPDPLTFNCTLIGETAG